MKLQGKLPWQRIPDTTVASSGVKTKQAQDPNPLPRILHPRGSSRFGTLMQMASENGILRVAASAAAQQ